MAFRKLLQHLIALVLASVCVLSSRASYAASTDASNRRDSASQREQQAEEQYQRGVEAFGQKRYLEAVDCFSRANALRPDGRLYFNIGLAFDRAGDVSNALSNYRSYIFEERTSEHTSKVAPRITELEKELAKTGLQQVTIRSIPAQAQVVIEGKAVGVTPWTGDLAPGFYHVKLSSSGFETAKLEFSLSLKAALTLSSTLEALPAKATSFPGAQSSEPASVERKQSTKLRAVNSEARALEPASQAEELWDGGEKPQSGSKIMPWVALGTGTALGLAALGFELDRRAAVDDAKSAGSRRVFDDNVERMQRDQTLARVFGTVAVTGVIVGVIWLLAPDDSPEETGTDVAGFSCLINGCSAGVRF